MITLTREEAQQVLDALQAGLSDDQPYIVRCKQAVETLRDRLAQPDVEDRYCHRLAVMLEASLLNPERTWDDAHKLLDEYKQAIRQRADAAGLPYVSPMGKD